MYDEGINMNKSLNIRIGVKVFNTVQELKTYIGNMLRDSKYEFMKPIGDNMNIDVSIMTREYVELDSEDTDFMMQLFSYHPKSKAKLKDFSKILIGENMINSRKTRCFYIQKQNNDKEDISYIKTCNHIVDIMNEKKMLKLLNNRQEQSISNIIHMLIKIFKYYPLSIDNFESLLSEVFPHRRLNEAIQTVFYINILRLSIVLFSHHIDNVFYKIRTSKKSNLQYYQSALKKCY